MFEYNFNIFNLLIISGVFHGFIFSVIVLSKKKIKNNFFLALTVLLLSLSNLQYFAIDINLASIYPFLNYFFIPWQWLILPMFYLYVEKTIDREMRSSLQRILLFSPFIIVLIVHVFQIFYKFFIDSSYIIPSHFKRGIYIYIELFSFIFNIVVILLTYKTILIYEKEQNNSKELKPETRWLKELIYVGFIICLLWFVALLLVIFFNLNKSYIFYPMWIGISALVYWMGYIGLGKAQLLEERVLLREQRKTEFVKMSKEKNTEAQLEILNFINSEVQTQKLFLNPELNIKSLAQELNLKPNAISESINKDTRYNFTDYINSFRVSEVKKMLENPDYSNYTIVAIGLEAGFNSKASFYRVFKKFEGVTPSEFLKNESQITTNT